MLLRACLVQEGVLSDTQGITFSFTAAACRRAFNMHRSVHVGNYHKAAKLLQAPTISVCCLPQESLSTAKPRGWELGMMAQTREQQTECVECKWYRGKGKPVQIFSAEVTHWAFCSLLRVMDRLQFVPQPGALWGTWVVFSCFSWLSSGFKVMWFLQTWWLLKEENKQGSDFLPCPLPWGTLSGPTWNHLSPLPTRAEIT